MRSQAPPLLPILRSRHQGELLAVLLLHPDREYTLSELSRRLNVPLSTVQGEANRLIELSAVSTFLSIPRCAAAAVGARQLIPWSGRSSPLRWCGYWIGRTSKGQHDALGPGRSDHRTADRRPTAPEGVRGAGGWRGSAGTGSPNCRDCPDDRHG